MPHSTRPSTRRPALGLIAALALLGSGCASTFKVEVNSITNPEVPPATTYALVPKDPNMPEKDIGYQDVADRVRTALAAKGMYEAPDPKDADIIVEIDYGARPPKTKVTTVNSTHVVPTDPLGREIDPLTGRPYPGTGGITIGTGGNTYPGSYPGSYPGGYPGGRMATVTTTEERITTVSEKYIRLTARENVKPHERGRKRAAQVWVVEAIVEDEDSDVHTCMPPMVNALTDYIGVSSGGKQTVKITTDEV